jgi:hypothetical protein
MNTVTAISPSGSGVRLLTLLAIAHASLAFYLWFCAFDANLVLTPIRLWQILSGLWLVWPIVLPVRGAVLGARFVRGALRPNPAVNRTRRYVPSSWRMPVAARRLP